MVWMNEGGSVGTGSSEAVGRATCKSCGGMLQGGVVGPDVASKGTAPPPAEPLYGGGREARLCR